MINDGHIYDLRARFAFCEHCPKRQGVTKGIGVRGSKCNGIRIVELLPVDGRLVDRTSIYSSTVPTYVRYRCRYRYVFFMRLIIDHRGRAIFLSLLFLAFFSPLNPGLPAPGKTRNCGATTDTYAPFLLLPCGNGSQRGTPTAP